MMVSAKLFRCVNCPKVGKHDVGAIWGNHQQIWNSGTINELDITEPWNNQAGQPGYQKSNLNQDTQVDNKNKNDIWFFNYGKEENLPE